MHVDWDGSPGARTSILLILIHEINTMVLLSIFKMRKQRLRESK